MANLAESSVPKTPSMEEQVAEKVPTPPPVHSVPTTPIVPSPLPVPSHTFVHAVRAKVGLRGYEEPMVIMTQVFWEGEEHYTLQYWRADGKYPPNAPTFVGTVQEVTRWVEKQGLRAR